MAGAHNRTERDFDGESGLLSRCGLNLLQGKGKTDLDILQVVRISDRRGMESPVQCKKDNTTASRDSSMVAFSPFSHGNRDGSS